MGLFNKLKGAADAQPAATTPVASTPTDSPPTSELKPGPRSAASDAPDPATPASSARAAVASAAVTRKRILFVDDSPVRLRHMEQVAHQLREDWNIVVIEGGQQALQQIEDAPADAVVTELHMEEFNGVEILNKVVKRYPRTVRFVCCGVDEHAPLESCLGTPPHVIPRGCDAETFESIVRRAIRLDEWISNAAVRKLMDQLTQLPALPTLYNQVMNELQSPTGSLDFVAKLISKDPIMTAKMLQMVNSAEMGLSRQIADTVEAVMLLGAERIKSLILLSHVFTQFDKAKCPGFQIEQLWMHSMTTGTQSMALSRAEGQNRRMAEMAFTAGLLHDIGRLLLAGNLPLPYSNALKQAASRKMSIGDVELEVFGATHAEVGACLLGTWGLPLPILEAIALHHQPSKSMDRSFSLLTAVHVANALDYEKRLGPDGVRINRLDEAFLHRLGVGEKLPEWREMCGIKSPPAARAA